MKVSAERQNLLVQGTGQIVVGQTPRLGVDFMVNPSSGHAPLTDVDLTATVSGTATGDITYRFDCTSDGTWERTITTAGTTYTATDLCSYNTTGNYTAKVRVEKGSMQVEGTARVLVFINL